MTERILARHPHKSKKGVNIDKAKYDQMKSAILAALKGGRELTLNELETAVSRQLKDSFEGSIMWYLMSVKLDLEARKVIQRMPFTQPQRVRLK